MLVPQGEHAREPGWLLYIITGHGTQPSTQTDAQLGANFCHNLLKQMDGHLSLQGEAQGHRWGDDSQLYNERTGLFHLDEAAKIATTDTGNKSPLRMIAISGGSDPLYVEAGHSCTDDGDDYNIVLQCSALYCYDTLIVFYFMTMYYYYYTVLR